MHKHPKLLLFASLLALSVSFASAETITLGSFATGTTASSLGFSSSQTAMNFAGYTAYSSPPAVASTPPLLSGTASTYALTSVSPTWLPALGNSAWVGSTTTSGPYSINPPYGYYQFNTTFSATGDNDYTGSIDLLADDTAEVLLNGSVLIPFGALGSDVHCADNPPTCLQSDLVMLNDITLVSGVDANTLTFIVEQAGLEGNTNDPSGVDFTASLIGDLPAPEPSSLILLGTGLLGAAGLLSRRRRPRLAKD